MKLTKFIKKNKTLSIVVITVIVFFISFQKWNCNNMTTEHYNPNKQESSMMDQLLYNSTQYYNHNKNNFLAKTEASGHTPRTPKPGEHCPVASWYGDRIWTNDGIRTSNIDKNVKNGSVDFENNITDYNITLPSTLDKKHKYQENNKYIVRKDIVNNLIESCEKPCVGDWIQNTNENKEPVRPTEIGLNNATNNINGMWWVRMPRVPNGPMAAAYSEIGTEKDRNWFANATDVQKITVSNTTLYFVVPNTETVSPEKHEFLLKSCSDNGNNPCTLANSPFNGIVINFTSDVDTVKTLIHSIVEIDVEKNNKLMWIIVKIKDVDGNPSVGRLYKGTFATTDVDGTQTQSLGLSLVDNIKKVGDDAKVEDDVTELSVSDNHVLIKVNGSVDVSRQSQYQILKKGNGKWENVDTLNTDVNLTVVSDNRLIS
jgi:hypothetical protein